MMLLLGFGTLGTGMIIMTFRYVYLANKIIHIQNSSKVL